MHTKRPTNSNVCKFQKFEIKQNAYETANQLKCMQIVKFEIKQNAYEMDNQLKCMQIEKFEIKQNAYENAK